MINEPNFRVHNNEVLIVDDNNANLKLLNDILVADGYFVRGATSGELALRSVMLKLPAIVILDVRMPEMDGFEVCKQLKADELSKNIPVIFISAIDDDQSKVKGFEVGGLDYITKPFRKEEVLARVRAYVKIRNVQLELEIQKNKLIEEIEERKVIEENLKEKEEQYRITLLSIGDGVITTDNQGSVKLMNQVAENLTSWTQTDASGKKLEEVFPIINENTRKEVEIPVRRVIREGTVVGLANHTLLIAKDGTERPIADSGAPIKNQHGEIVGVVLVFRDQTEERKAEKELRESEYFFRESQRAALTGSYNLDLSTGLWTSSEVLDQIFGIGKDYTRSVDGWEDLIFQDDREMMDRHFKVEVLGQQKPFDKEYRIFRKSDGATRWVHGLGQLTFDDQGNMLSMIGTMRDITERKQEEYELKFSEEKFRNVFENSPIGKSMTGTDGTLNVNRAFCDMLGYTQAELAGKHWTEISHPDDEQKAKELIAGLLAEKITNARIEKRYIHKNGNIVWADVSTFLQRDLEGNPQYFITSVINNTEQKEAENSLRKSEEKFRALIENNSDAISLVDSNGLEIYHSPSCQRILGYTDDERNGKSMMELVHPEDAGALMGLFYEILQQPGIIPMPQTRIKRADGSWVWIEGIANNLLANPDIQAIVVNFRDITERKIAEEALLDADQKMKAFFDQSLDGFFFMMLDEPIVWNEKADKAKLLEYAFSHQRITRINNAMLEQYGATSDQFIGLTPNQMFVHNIEHGKNEWRKLFDYGKLHTETDERKLNGEQMFVEGDYICLYDSQGHITGHFGIQRDVTQSKLAVETIQNEHKLLRTLIDNLPVTVYVKDLECRKIVANALDLEVMGIQDEAKVLGKTDLELFDNEIGQRGYEDDRNVVQTGQPVINREEMFFDKSGIQRWLLTSKIPLFDQQGKASGLVGIGRDITEQKMAETQIRKLTESIEQSPSTIMITDIHGTIEYVNPKFLEITGYTKEEAIGQNPRLLKSGKTPVEVYPDLWNTILAGNVWRGEFLNRKKNGELYWEWATVTSIKNEKGVITNYIAIKEDISLRKKMEADLIVAKEKAEESDRLKSAFLANMSHEVRTPLNSIIGFSELLADPDFGEEQKTEFIQHIITNGNSLLTIISDIMDISKMESGQIKIRKSEVHVNKIIAEIEGQYSLKVKEKDLEFKVDLTEHENEIFIVADIERLRQIFNNLISNALKFTAHGYIQLSYQHKGSMVEFCVRDTGIGIPAEYHEIIFNRFRQVDAETTRKYGGNGLGLAITKNLVELMDGKIWLESEPGYGSGFYFTLPASKFYCNDSSK